MKVRVVLLDAHALTAPVRLATTHARAHAMNNPRFVEVQTQVADLFLAELSQVSRKNVNFNNTRQFDLLLAHLELTVSCLVFSSVPSVNVLHVLLTLVARSLLSNWSHFDVLANVVCEPSEYMKQINFEYDNAVYKPSLQARSAALVEVYLDLSQNPLTHATRLLEKNLSKVFSSFVSTDILSMVGLARSRSPPTPVDDIPVSTIDVVEVISDSEESAEEVELLPELVHKASLNQASFKSLTSLTDLGSRTSGLGETATLFETMPHLLAQATPDPDGACPAPVARSWAQIQVFDDLLVALKFSNSSYNIWELVRWTFWCAETSSLYQRFLFNSRQTNVHLIYKAYSDLLHAIFRYAELDTKQTFIGRIIRVLGAKSTLNDRAVEYVFTGLEVPSSSRPAPCYKRDLVLINQDPLIRISRSKTELAFNDNDHSVSLRAKIISLLFSHNYHKAKNDVQSNISLLDHVADKLLAVPLTYRKLFLVDISSSEINSKIRPELVHQLIKSLLRAITGVKPAETPELLTTVKSALTSSTTYTALSEDVTFKSVEQFLDKWDFLVICLQWIVGFLVPQITKAELSNLQKASAEAERLMELHYHAFLDRHDEMADLLEDCNFLLQAGEIQALKTRHRPLLQALTGAVKQ